MINIIGNGIFCNFFNYKKYQQDYNNKKTFLEYSRNGGIQWARSRNNFINQSQNNDYYNSKNQHRLFFKNNFKMIYVKKMMFGNDQLTLPKNINQVLGINNQEWVWKVINITNPQIDWFKNNQFGILVTNKKLNLTYQITSKITEQFINFDYQKITLNNKSIITEQKIDPSQKEKIINWVKYALLIMNTVYQFYYYSHFYQLRDYESFPKKLQRQWNNYQKQFLNAQDQTFTFNYFPEVLGHLNHHIGTQPQINTQMIHGYFDNQNDDYQNQQVINLVNDHSHYQPLLAAIANQAAQLIEINLFALNPTHDQPLFYAIKKSLIVHQKQLQINYYYYHLDEVAKIKTLFEKVGIENIKYQFIDSAKLWNR